MGGWRSSDRDIASYQRKVALLRNILANHAADSLYLSSQAATTWLTGARSFINIAAEASCYKVVISSDNVYLVVNNIEAGVRLGEVLNRMKHAYADRGFADECELHHQGGITGYFTRVTLAKPDVVQLSGQIFLFAEGEEHPFHVCKFLGGINMDIGLYPSCFFEWDIEATFAWMERHRIRHAELYGGPKYAFIDWDEVAKGRTKAILNPAERHGIVIQDLMYGALNFLDPENSKRDQAVEYLKKMIICAKNLGATSVSTFTGRDPSLDLESNLKQMKFVFPNLIDFAAANDVKLLLENCPMSHAWPPKYNIAINPDMWDLIFSDLNSEYFGLNFDPSHLVWQGIDVITAVYRFKEKIYLAQAKDSQVMGDVQRTRGILDGYFWRHRIAGQGDVDWNRFISALVDIGYRQPLFIEHEDPFFSRDIQAVERGVLLTKQYLEPFLDMSAVSDEFSEVKEHGEDSK